ncbi:hypothetical protein BDE02_04G072700 [Populus trichocarpa]|nr:hypothetical protein BDE02_04G072700 [Populus trichocarpa]
MKFLLCILSLWKSAPTFPLLSFVLGLAFFSLRSHENPLQFLFNVNDTNDPIKKRHGYPLVLQKLLGSYNLSRLDISSLD